jgi:hypothetical protein
MLSGGLPFQEFQLRRRLGIYILMLELIMLPASFTMGVNHLSWRCQVCDVITSLNSILSPLLLPGAIWLALPPSNWRSLAKYLTIFTGAVSVLIGLLLISLASSTPAAPVKKLVLKNGEIISVGYVDTGATGGSVSVWRERPYGSFFIRTESRTLGWCEPKLTTLPDGKQMLSVVGEAPVDIDQFFLSGDQ